MISFWYPVGLGIIGASQLVVLAGISAWSVACSGVLVSLAVGAGFAIGRAEPQMAPRPATTRPDVAVRDACTDALGVWARQIDTSRLTANEAVLRLTQVFEGTVQKLEAMLAAAGAALAEMRSQDGVMAAVRHGDEELLRAMKALLAAQKSREEKVGGYAHDLRDMANDVQGIAMQIRLLSFNAAVEAARAGGSAGGFAVVASEMRQLAAVSGEKGAGIAKKVQAINATLENFVHGEGTAAHNEIDSVSEAESTLREVMQRFRTLATLLADAVRVMEAKTGEVHADVSDALVAMQFQDRVSQIQQHVVGGIGALRERLATGGADGFDPKSWAARMARDLSMEEEFDNLRGHTTAKARPSRETTYF